jgi:hypothetical protein
MPRGARYGPFPVYSTTPRNFKLRHHLGHARNLRTRNIHQWCLGRRCRSAASDDRRRLEPTGGLQVEQIRGSTGVPLCPPARPEPRFGGALFRSKVAVLISRCGCPGPPQKSKPRRVAVAGLGPPPIPHEGKRARRSRPLIRPAVLSSIGGRPRICPWRDGPARLLRSTLCGHAADATARSAADRDALTRREGPKSLATPRTPFEIAAWSRRNPFDRVRIICIRRS